MHSSFSPQHSHFANSTSMEPFPWLPISIRTHKPKFLKPGAFLIVCFSDFNIIPCRSSLPGMISIACLQDHYQFVIVIHYSTKIVSLCWNPSHLLQFSRRFSSLSSFFPRHKNPDHVFQNERTFAARGTNNVTKIAHLSDIKALRSRSVRYIAELFLRNLWLVSEV